MTNLGASAFASCANLTKVCFEGNAPGIGTNVFNNDYNATVYYVPGTTGWGSTFGSRPTATWWPYTYTTNSGTITITGYTGSGGAVTIPSTINTLPVTSISERAFSDCLSLTSVTIPTNVTSIGYMAFFDCVNLSSATIPNSVTSIPPWLFYNCGRLTTVSIPSSITTIEYQAFEGCSSLITVTIPANVTSIGGSAFAGCTALSNIIIPAAVASIGYYAFSYCSSLTAIAVDALNPSYTSVDGVLFNKIQTTLIRYPARKAGTSYTLPNSVTTIERESFAGCTNLTSVTIPNSVNSIGVWAFAQCSSLTNATIGNGVTSIGGAAFHECTSLTNITIPNSVTSIGSGAFRYCTNLTGAYFWGNAPSATLDVFDYDNHATAYYLRGTAGWGSMFGGRPTAAWLLPNPLILNSPSFGVQSNRFGFIISWATNLPVVVEASSNLAGGTWTSLQTCTLTNGSIYFSDPAWTNHPTRFYRLRSP